ncbi:MAG: sulfite exporter TauE/SafE family protein [Thermosynechococcaceae cyanobacterium]
MRTRYWIVMLLAMMTALMPRPALAHPGHILDLEALLPQNLTPALVLTSTGLAALFGAGHAFSPGHGKTMVTAYLVGSHSTPKHALLLGLITTVTHTFTVFVLGFVALLLSRYIVPEQFYPFLSLGSGLMVTGVGVWLFLRLRKQRSHQPAHQPSHAHAGHSHDDHVHATHSHDNHVHSHSASDHHAHHHHLPPKITWKSLMALGVAGGMIPCPSALILLLSAIALQQTALGLLLVSSFSVGLAIVLTSLGLAAVYTRQWFEQLPQIPFLLPLRRNLPMLSAFVTLWVGLLLSANTLLGWHSVA